MSEDTTERDGQFWRKLEREAYAIAAGMTDPQARRIMLYITQGTNAWPIEPTSSKMRGIELPRLVDHLPRQKCRDQRHDVGRQLPTT
jgi:hypothetical protein